MTNITVRRSVSADQGALERLAALDSARPLRGPALVAEANAQMIAALPMGAGRPIADPFEPTAEIVALLELRKAQLARGGVMAGRWTRRVRELAHIPARA